MSQKSEKYARNLENRVRSVEDRMIELERRQVDSDMFIRGMKNLDASYAQLLQAESKRHRNAVTAARRRTARLWKINAVLVVVVTVLLGLAAACCIVYASAQEPETTQDGPVVQTVQDVEQAENTEIEAALLANAIRLDGVTVTHYDTCLECCGKTDGITASGVRATPGVTVAVDPDIIPLGADVLVDYGDGELHYYRADDVGGAIQGNRIDVCVSSHDEALELGRRTATVWWVMP